MDASWFKATASIPVTSFLAVIREATAFNSQVGKNVANKQSRNEKQNLNTMKLFGP